MGTPRFKALLIGNARFERDPHNLPALKGPPEDLKLLEGVLTDSSIGIHAAGDVRTLLDATNSEVREAIDDFFNSSAPDDQLLFYYSGHGRQDANNSLYLCTRDTRTDRLPSTAVGDVLINQMIATSHAARTLILLDCCHSGSFKGGGMSDALTQAGGRFVLSSCRDQQLATDAGDSGGGSAFTTHLVQALLGGEVDANADGYVTLTEVYHHILPKLKIATQQIPQLHLDKTVGDPPLGRARARERVSKAAVERAGGERAILAVSDTKIELQDVHLGEELPAVTIDVFNEGGGDLDWSATSDDTWISVETGTRLFKLWFKPVRVGPHRGNVYVRDAGRGGSKRISVFLEVIEAVAKPVLEMATSTVELGRLRVGARAMPQVVRLTNGGSGELLARAHSTNPALRVTINDDALTIDPDVSHPVSLRGEIIVNSAGGRAVVKVTGEVEAGPLLVIKPGKVLDFGEVPVGMFKTLLLQVENGGKDHLDWSCRKEGTFFSVESGDDPQTIKVSVGGEQEPGAFIGSIFIKSNGGDATVNVRVQILPATMPPIPAVPPPLPPLLPLPPVHASLAGWWQNPNGRILITGGGGHYRYVDYNSFGVQIGSGTLVVNGAQVMMQGSSLLIPYKAQLFLSGNVMSGTVSCFGSQGPVAYTRCG